MSLFTWGVNVMVRGQVKPADSRPGGVKVTEKKSFISSSNGKSLNELKVNDTFVRIIV